MDRETLCKLLKQRYDSPSKQERVAANYVLENPHDVAVVSMCDLARGWQRYLRRR